MSIDRGPATDGRPLSGVEKERLTQVKPTPYMDEADLPDPTWALPTPTDESLALSEGDRIILIQMWNRWSQ